MLVKSLINFNKLSALQLFWEKNACWKGAFWGIELQMQSINYAE